LASTAALAFAFTTDANAAPVVEIGLGIDGSGSISSSDFDLQIDAYRSVLGSIIPTDGSVAIGIWLFSTGVSQLFQTTVIDGQDDLDDIDTALANAIQPNGFTAIGDTINTIANDLLNNTISSARQLIDISTDGFSNVGANPNTAADGVVAAGIEQVNCLGVGASANCGFISGDGSFSVIANSFADFEDALETKIRTETGQVPEPATLALLAGGLLAGGAAARRRRKA
jgi:hypothetical protein